MPSALHLFLWGLAAEVDIQLIGTYMVIFVCFALDWKQLGRCLVLNAGTFERKIFSMLIEIVPLRGNSLLKIPQNVAIS